MDLLKGGTDIHVHSSPSVVPRKEDDIEMAKKARNAKMKGFVIKAHEGCSAARAYLTRKVVDLAVYGGLCLNTAVGGLNPEAVEASLKLRGKIVWFPTVSARNHKNFFSSPEGYRLGFNLKDRGVGLTIFDESGKIKEEVCQILELIKQNNAVLATGHLSLKETASIIEMAINEFKIEKLLFNHPDINFIAAPLTMQIELARKGVMIEKCYVALLPPWSVETMAELADAINVIGAQHCILSSDLGQVENPSPPDGMKTFLRQIQENGIKEKDIRSMWVNNSDYLMS